MNVFLIKDVLTECGLSDLKGSDSQFVAVLTPDEWLDHADDFDMGIDLGAEIDPATIRTTRAEVNYDSLTGTFLIPDRDDLQSEPARFAFALDEKGVVYRFWEKKSPDKTVVRFVTSWASKEETVRELVRILKEVV